MPILRRIENDHRAPPCSAGPVVPSVFLERECVMEGDSVGCLRLPVRFGGRRKFTPLVKRLQWELPGAETFLVKVIARESARQQLIESIKLELLQLFARHSLNRFAKFVCVGWCCHPVLDRWRL